MFIRIWINELYHFPQIRVRAIDGGDRFAEALVTITVNRNLESPRFEPETYEVEILDNEPLSSP